MQYRKFGRTEKDVSALGFGAMRLPVKDSESDIDVPAAVEMIRDAIDAGVNYVDTAYPYHGGNSEVVVGKALQDGYRDKVFLATKSPIWQIEKTHDFDRILDEQFERLQTDHIDFYLLHCVQATFWPKMLDLNVFDWADKARADGRIGELGFSFHDNYDVFKQVVDAYDWTFCQIQYNLVNEEVQAGTKGSQVRRRKGPCRRRHGTALRRLPRQSPRPCPGNLAADRPPPRRHGPPMGLGSPRSFPRPQRNEHPGTG